MGVEKRWQLRPQDEALSAQLAERLDIHSIVAQICLNRGLSTLSSVRRFLGQTINICPETFPPDLLNAAVKIVRDVIVSGKPILVYGDYDVDGMTSTALMVLGLRAVGAKVHYMIPSRFEHGYGLHLAVVDQLKQLRSPLLITLDCGVSNVHEISEIKRQLGAQVIVLDHHTIPEILPPCDVMLNPQALPKGHYLASLCTVGIVYQFLQAFLPAMGSTLDLSLYEDIVGLGTVADVAVLDGFNRDVLRRGLQVLSQRPQVGLKALLDVAGFDHPTVTPRDLGFVIAPRLNASGRLSHAGIGVELLLSQDRDQAMRIATSLETLNQDRRAIDLSIFMESMELLKSGYLAEDDRIIAVSNRGWHSGVIGITASKLVEHHGLPSVVMADEGDIVRGSARSTGEVSIYKVLHSCRSFFESFGGHKQAAGFSIKPDKVPAFIEAVRASAKTLITDYDLRPILQIDAFLEPSFFTLSMVDHLSALYPYGQGNDQPVFYHHDLRPVHFKTVGNGQHLKVTFTDRAGRAVVDGIGFGLASKLDLLSVDSVAVAFHLVANEWQGRRSPQLQLLDIKPSFQK